MDTATRCPGPHEGVFHPWVIGGLSGDGTPTRTPYLESRMEASGEYPVEQDKGVPERRGLRDDSGATEPYDVTRVEGEVEPEETK